MFCARKILLRGNICQVGKLNNKMMMTMPTMNKLLMPQVRYFTPPAESKSVRDVTNIDADAKIQFPPSEETVSSDAEPRFLEQV